MNMHAISNDGWRHSRFQSSLEAGVLLVAKIDIRRFDVVEPTWKGLTQPFAWSPMNNVLVGGLTPPCKNACLTVYSVFFPCLQTKTKKIIWTSQKFMVIQQKGFSLRMKQERCHHFFFCSVVFRQAEQQLALNSDRVSLPLNCCLSTQALCPRLFKVI